MQLRSLVLFWTLRPCSVLPLRPMPSLRRRRPRPISSARRPRPHRPTNPRRVTRRSCPARPRPKPRPPRRSRQRKRPDRQNFWRCVPRPRRMPTRFASPRQSQVAAKPVVKEEVVSRESAIDIGFRPLKEKPVAARGMTAERLAAQQAAAVGAEQVVQSGNNGELRSEAVGRPSSGLLPDPVRRTSRAPAIFCPRRARSTPCCRARRPSRSRPSSSRRKSSFPDTRPAPSSSTPAPAGSIS